MESGKVLYRLAESSCVTQRSAAAAWAAAGCWIMATRPSFRPRPIDPSRPLPILRTCKDLKNADDVVVSRALPQVGTGVEAAELEERHLQQALLASVYGEDAKNSKSFDIPIPVFETVEPPACPSKSSFVRPPDVYIMFDKSDEDLENSMVDYDGDHVDEAFVTKYNIAHKKQSIPLDMDGLERGMDALEKIQGRILAEEEDALDVDLTLKPDPKKGASAAAAAAAAVAAAKKKRVETKDSLLQFSQVRSELVATLPTCTDTGRREIHAYWVDRRLAHGDPFHRLYIKAPATDDPNPGVAFRPRGREDGGGGRRMNTYENFKRARILREEFDVLRNVMQSVLSRERTKADELALSALHTRMQCVASGGPRLALLSRNICVAEKEGYSVGDGDAKIAISCRGLGVDLPASVEAELNRMPFGPDKKQKKLKRKGTGIVANRTEAKLGGTSATFGSAGTVLGDSSQNGATDGRGSRPQASILSQPNGVDSYGFDDHGNRFLKHMRYFAGGFMNYGVCPYDHRVFAAASERNTVKDHPCEPKPFMVPAANVKLGRPVQSYRLGGKVRPRQTTNHDAFRAPSSSHPAPYVNSKSQEDALEFGRKRHLGPKFGANVSKRKRRPIKVRGRVGRGGRVILDRVVFEPERGVKAASYPASVEMGGVFTAGLPLESANHVASDDIGYGILGRVNDLAVSVEDRALVGPLQPMVDHAQGCRDSEGRIVYWPSRKAARAKELQAKFAQREVASVGERKQVLASGGLPEPEYLRNMPAYACRSNPLVEVVDVIQSD